MSKIRIGLINCDLHAMYYAVLIGGYDPVVLRDDPVSRGHAAYYYFYTNYGDPRKITTPPVGGFTLAKVWDEDPKLAGAISDI